MKSEFTTGDAVENVFADELKPGTALLHGQYVIEEFLNSGGFGITYLAKDSLDRLVVIKECFPESICSRSNTTVRVRSRTQAEAFRTIVDLFIEEARSLARLSHPNIVGVHQVFEDNETAYMAMDFVEGQDLLQIADSSAAFNPGALEQITLKLLDAIEFIHDVGVLHRDIAPDNILLSSDNEPVLIDFGAARENVSMATSYLGSMRTVKDGYSPQEFYANNAEQHPSSDLYSLAASLYHVMSKELPANAQARLSAIASGEDDPYVSIAERVTGYSEHFLSAIDRALSVFPNDRLQSAAAWRAEITQTPEPQGTRGSISRPTLAVDNGNMVAITDDTHSEGGHRPNEGRPTPTRKVRPGAGSRKKNSDSAVFKETVGDSAHAQGSSNKGVQLGVAAVAFMALVGGGVFLMSGGEEAVTGTEPDTAPVLADANSADTGTAPSVSTGSRKVEQVPFFLTEQQEASASEQLIQPEPAPETTASQVTAPQTARTPVPGNVSFADILANRSTDTPAAAEDVPAEQGAATTATGTSASIQDAKSVVTGLVVSLDVTSDPADPSAVSSANGPAAEHLQPGLRVVSINGFPIEDLGEFQRVVSGTLQLEAGASVDVSFGLADPTSGSTFVRNVELPVVQRTMLLNGVSFETVRNGNTWQTFVTNGSGDGQSDLQTGDELIALMPENERIDGESTLPDLLEREIGAGSEQFSFAINRGEDMWLVSMSYDASSFE